MPLPCSSLAGGSSRVGSSTFGWQHACCTLTWGWLQGLARLRQRRKMRRDASSAGGMLGAGTNEVQLEWRDLTCTLTDKKSG